MIEHSADILVEPPCVTHENVQGQKLHKTELETPGSLLSS